MRGALATSAWMYWTVVSGSILIGRQTAFPSCALNCSLTVTTWGTCSAADTACLCSYKPYVQAYLSCVNEQCTNEADLQQAHTAITSSCSAAGVNLATVTPGLPISTAFALGTTAAGLTTATRASTSDGAAAALPTYTDSFVAPTQQTSSSHTASIVGSIVGGVIFFGSFAATLVMRVLRRHRRATYRAQPAQYPPMNYGRGGPPTGGGMTPATPFKTRGGTTPVPNLPHSYFPYQAPAHRTPPPVQMSITTPATPPPAAPPAARVFVPRTPSHLPTTYSNQTSPPQTSTGATASRHLALPSTAQATALDPARAPTAPHSTPHQVALMERMQRLNPQQMALIERLAGNSSVPPASSQVNSGPSTSIETPTMDPPPEYDFKDATT